MIFCTCMYTPSVNTECNIKIACLDGMSKKGETISLILTRSIPVKTVGLRTPLLLLLHLSLGVDRSFLYVVFVFYVETNQIRLLSTQPSNDVVLGSIRLTMFLLLCSSVRPPSAHSVYYPLPVSPHL